VLSAAAEPIFENTAPEPTIATSLGGLFFLLAYAQYLGLYGDFTTPRRPGIAIDPWDFVTLLGRRLIGRARADPVWDVLAALAGRRMTEQPGRGFAAPGTWRLPSAWLAPFATDEAWTWALAGDRLRVRHPARFDAVDAPARGDPQKQLARELRRYGSPRIRHVRGAPARAEPRLERWVTWLARYSRARLALALGVAPADIRQMLLEQSARIAVTATTVDVFFALDAVNVEVRRAGLDRDLGWFPAARRAASFHFE
jgi:hypothetical protein